MEGKWVTAWSIAHCSMKVASVKTAGKTLRATIVVNIGGPGLRLRLSNRYGTRPVRAAVSVRVGQQAVARVSFSGRPDTLLAPGRELESDALALGVRAGDAVTVSIYLPDRKTQPASGNITDGGAVHCSSGDCTMLDTFEAQPYQPMLAKLAGLTIPEPLTILAGIDVLAETDVRVVGAFGDSITQMGFWVNPLRTRLYREYPGQAALLNLGVGGNRVLGNTSHARLVGELFGRAAVERMEWDLFGQSGMDTVLFALGINDITQPGAGPMSPAAAERCSFEELTAGINKIVDACHFHNMKVVGCTITPFGGYKTHCEATSQLWKLVNGWILQCGAFDGALDFAAWIADPADRKRMLPEYDSGDHLHPNALGGEALARNVSLDLLMR